MGSSSGTRVAPCSSRSASGSAADCGRRNSACPSRGASARSARPDARRSSGAVPEGGFLGAGTADGATWSRVRLMGPTVVALGIDRILHPG